MDKKIVFRNWDIKRYIPMPVTWWLLERIPMYLFPNISEYGEFVSGMTFILRLIFGSGIIIIFLYEFEFMVLRENKITVWQWLIPSFEVRVNGKPYVAATIKYPIVPMPGYRVGHLSANGRQAVNMGYEYKLYLFMSSSPILSEDYFYDPWKEDVVYDSNGIAVSKKNTISKVRYCENYYNALVEYYGCEIGESYLIECYENNVIL